MQLPTDDEHHNIEAIEHELSQVKARLSQLEDLFNRESIVIDSKLVDEMVSLQHRALDLMKVLYAREKGIFALMIYSEILYSCNLLKRLPLMTTPKYNTAKGMP